MDTLPNLPHVTPEQFWALVYDNERILKEQRAENDRIIKEMRADNDRRIKENELMFKKSKEDFEQRCKKSDEDFEIWCKKNDKIFKEMRADSDRRKAETDRRIEENTREMIEQRKQMREMKKQLGGMGNSHGSFAEAYFYNAFENGKKNFFGEKFDDMEKNAKGLKKEFKDEYDILLINGKTVCIIEVKYKATLENFPKIMRKPYTFRNNFPDYKAHKVHLALASMCFLDIVEQECINRGIAIIKQVGKAVVILDEHLKAF